MWECGTFSFMCFCCINFYNTCAIALTVHLLNRLYQLSPLQTKWFLKVYKTTRE